MKIPVPIFTSSPLSVLFRFLFILLCTPCILKGQIGCGPGWPKDTSATRIRNIGFTTPVSKNCTINGIAIGFEPATWRGGQTLNINGLSISAAPTDPLYAYAVLIGATCFPKHFSNIHTYPEDKPVTKKFNGLIIGSVSVNAHTNGVNISAIINASRKMNGLSIACLFNHHYSFKGVLIAGLRNKTTIGRGLQIGLLNRCKEGKLVQIGLLNRIGNRTIPFINFQFNRKNDN